MRTVRGETCPIPADPVLAEAATAFNDAGAWVQVVDRDWRLVYMTDDIRLSNGRLEELVPLPLGERYFSAEALDVMLGWSGGMWSIDGFRALFGGVGSWAVSDAAGGAEEVLEYLDPRLADLLGGSPDRVTAQSFVVPTPYNVGGAAVEVATTTLRLRREDGRIAGTAILSKPAVGMSVLGTMAGAGDLRHFVRVQRVAKPARRSAAILFGDLEGSSPLSRRLSAAGYFRFGRRLVRAADRIVIDAGGVVGRHAGDGVVAYFLTQDAASESAAVRACVEAMRALREAAGDIAVRSDLDPADVVIRFGLHWGATLHVGQIITVARAEVNALGDEVNEAARIEACATGGRALASKTLVERLDSEDASALGIDLERIGYTALADLPTATEKARRDAPSIAVCDL